MLTVNGEEIADGLLRDEAALLRPKYYEVMGGGDPIALEMQLREWSRENVIERVLLRQEAAREGVEVPALIERVQGGILPPNRKEVAQFYAHNRQNFWVPELFHCAHIVKTVDETHGESEAREAIGVAEAELSREVAFSVVADAHSDSRGQGGDLGWVARGQMMAEFEAAVFGMKVGETSGVFRTQFGWHIGRLMGRRPEGVPALQDVREHLAAQLLEERRQKAVEAFVDRLREHAAVTF